jgi:hypothetical protein
MNLNFFDNFRNFAKKIDYWAFFLRSFELWPLASLPKFDGEVGIKKIPKITNFKANFRSILVSKSYQLSKLTLKLVSVKI